MGLLLGTSVAQSAKGHEGIDIGTEQLRTRRVISPKGRVLMCGTCMDARGLGDGDMMDGPTRSTTDELAQATLAADKVLVF